jgi:Reverse transcriptase (RNA-dependent DNA polymerase)
MVIKYDPVTLAAYAQKHGLLNEPGWKRLKTIAQRLVHDSQGAYNVMENKQTKGPVYQFGIQVPHHVQDAYKLDKKNNNTKWQAMQEEINSLLDYSTFEDKGKLKYLTGYKNIRVNFVFAAKHNLHHKARLVAGGHLTDPNTNVNTYSSVVSLCSMRIAIAAAELNELDIMVGDVSFVYLEAHTQEKVCFIAGLEFGPLEGHLLVIVHPLYGLRTSGDLYANVMRIMDFYPYKADPDVWLKDCDTHYEYVLVYVDDLMFIGKKPQAFFDSLTTEHSFKLKGIGKASYNLGGEFFCDSDGTLAWGAQLYVEQMLVNYKTMFGYKPKEYSTPMAEKDHPEIDNSELLDTLGIKHYQSLIGALKWLVTLGCFDIHLGVATMSSFCVTPRQGHLDCLKQIHGYLKRNPTGATRFQVQIPNHEQIATPIQ